MKVKVLNTQTQVEIREMNLSDSIEHSGECLLGRSPHSGLVLDSPDVSRLHAKFSVEDGQYYFYDLGSANGSLINGKFVQSNQGYLLKPGDIIRLGEFVLILQTVSEQPEEIAATVIGDPNATVISFQPNIDRFSNGESELAIKTIDGQENQLAIDKTEQLSESEDFEVQTEEQDRELLAEVSSTEGETISPEMGEQASQAEAIEISELSELEALEKPELEKLDQALVEVEGELEPSVEAIEPISEQPPDHQISEDEEFESDSFPESTLIQPDETEAVSPLQSIKLSEAESSQVAASDALSELNESIESEELDSITDSIPAEPTLTQPDHQTETETFATLEPEPEFVSEPDLIQFSIQSDEPLAPLSDQRSEQKANQLEELIETINSAAEFSLSESSQAQNEEVTDTRIVESTQVSNETEMRLLESAETGESLAETEELLPPISQLSSESPDELSEELAASLEPPIEPVEDIQSADETENLEATDLPVEDKITESSTETIEELDPVATLEQITSESLEAMPLETVEPVASVAAETAEIDTDLAEADLVETGLETGLETDLEADLDSQIPEMIEASVTYPDKYIALLAHENQKSELIDFVVHHKDLFSRCLTVATPGISDLLKRELGFEVSQQTPAVPSDGYQTINSLITADKILAVILLRDFFTPQVAQANDEAFSRSCNIRQIMFASNLPTAEAIVHAIRAIAVTLQS